MGFNKVQPASGPFTVVPGVPIRVLIWYGGGGIGQQGGNDHGAQWIMADPVDVNVPGNSLAFHPSSLQVADFTKVRDIWSSNDLTNNMIELDLGRSVVRYEATVTNTGSSVATFTLQGGGNT